MDQNIGTEFCHCILSQYWQKGDLAYYGLIPCYVFQESCWIIFTPASRALSYWDCVCMAGSANSTQISVKAKDVNKVLSGTPCITSLLDRSCLRWWAWWKYGQGSSARNLWTLAALRPQFALFYFGFASVNKLFKYWCLKNLFIYLQLQLLSIISM